MAYEAIRDKYACGAPYVRPPPPLDGPGPRGGLDCYYMSRVKNSTFRYERFVRKLRADEDEQRKGHENNLIKLKDQQISDFFIRCDRRLLINNVSRRVDLCLKSYEDDLNMKRAKLAQILRQEEERDIRLFVEQAQAANEALWQEKMERLEYLLAKRRKEHEEKYKDLPISKCVHALPCIIKKRAKEAQEIQLYQMKEKESRRKSEKELEKMWHEVCMKEAEALTARMELEEIERFRHAMSCKQYSDDLLALNKKKKEQDRERLKKESIAWREFCDGQIKQEEEEAAMRRQKSIAVGQDRKQAIEEREAAIKKLEAEEKMINDTWASLTNQSLADDKAKMELRRRKEKDLVTCNRKLIELREARAHDTPEDIALIQSHAKRIQDEIDKRTCKYLLWSQKTNRDVRKGMIEQIMERKKGVEDLKKKMKEEDEYHEQLFKQNSELISYHEMLRAKERKEHQKNLVAQIEYNKLLKERALQEEMEQRRKAQQVAKEYQEEINRMVARPFHQDDIHPFMKQMISGRTVTKCPCSKPDYCK